jgi:hypothetical protein
MVCADRWLHHFYDWPLHQLAEFTNWPREAPRFKFDKRSQFFIGVHSETLSVVAMRVSISETVA